MYTNGIILKNVDETIDDKDVEFLFQNLGGFLKYLKYTSKQFNLKVDGSVESMHRREKVSVGVSKNVIATSQMMIRGDYYNSMASWDNLKQADKLCYSNYNVPVFEDILLDAIDGRASHEYRKAILYATIAIESMLANLYDKQYKTLLEKNSGRKKFRLVSQKGIDKDPIYKALSDKTDFRKLLHEIPLYLNNKSLLLENEQLYTNTLKLYTTRNKIVHWGAPLNPNYDQILEVNEEGAETAINIALQLFSWMGITDYNNLANRNLIELKKRT